MAACGRMPNVETGRTAFESPVHISVAADSTTDSREFCNAVRDSDGVINVIGATKGDKFVCKYR
jgi:hypothetical protein